jgi:uncharacterized protein
MKFSAVLIAAAFLAASPVPAQTPATGAPAPTAPAHQPGVPAARSGSAANKSAASAEKTDAAKEAAIRHLMEITQTSKLGDNINAYVTGQVRQVLSQAYQPDVLAKFMDTFSQRLTAAAPPSAVTDAAIPIYARAFSMEDIQGLTQFYESPLGQRVVKTLPQVVQDSQETGVQMQERGAMKVLQAMSDDYPELKNLLKPSGAGPGDSPSPDKPGTAGPAPQTAPSAPSK